MEEREKCWRKEANEKGERVYQHRCGKELRFERRNLVDIVDEPFWRMMSFFDLADPEGENEEAQRIVNLGRDLLNSYRKKMEDLCLFIMEEFGNVQIDISMHEEIPEDEPLGVQFEPTDVIKKRRAE